MSEPGGSSEPGVSSDQASQLSLPLWENDAMKLER